MFIELKRFYLLVVSLFSSLLLFADYAYDINGNISKVFIPENGEVCYTYDPIGRLTEAHYPDGKVFSYSYDFNSRLTAIGGSQGTTTFSHNLLNRVEKVQLPFEREIFYQYDPMGRLIQIVYPDGETTDYQYNARGRLIQMKDGSGITYYEYDDETNLILKETLPNGVSTSYCYDGSYRIAEVLHQNQGCLIAYYRYYYDEGGDCISVDKETPKERETITYDYDPLHRLILAQSSHGDFEKYTYDPLGNRLTKETPSETIHYVYDHHNRLIQEGGTYYEYDSVGNLIQKRSSEKKVVYSYDPTGKLVSYFDGNSHVTFEYDGLGHRISKTVDGKTTYFINDPVAPLSRVLMEISPDGEIKKYSYGLSRTAQTTKEGSSYFLYSHPGKSVSHLVHDNGTITALEYDSFGIPISNISQTSYGFNGEGKDEETGLIYLRHRYYDPTIGRFISPDSFLGNLMKPQTLNPYVFVLNNPIAYIDPDGFSEVLVPIDLYANPPGTLLPCGIKSYGGHVWIGYTEVQGNRLYVGVYPGSRFLPDDNIRSLCEKTYHMRVWVTPEVQSRAIKVMYDNNYTLVGNNCVDHVIKVLDAINYPHPHFGLQEEGDVSNPAKFCEWISREKQRIHPDFLPREGAILIGDNTSSETLLGRDTHPKIIDFHFYRPNYGGVLFDKSVEVFTELSDILGVIYDEQLGQMILCGRKNLTFPQMDLDDLAVAVRSIYGLGRKGAESPGVSMTPGYKDPKKEAGGCMVVSYFGETENTRFGQVMFEADRILKILSMGKDNLSGKIVKSSVPGYKDLHTIRLKEGCPPSSTYCRLWFVPQKITLSESHDGTSMLFNEARMEVLTESTLRKRGVIENLAAEKFAQHFTQHYDAFSQEYPILSELKRLGKIAAIVRWIYEKNLPFDLSFFQNYTPNYFETPKSCSMTASLGQKQYIIGGVAYSLNQNNYLVQKSQSVDRMKEEVLKERPSDETLSWSFGRGMVAVAKQVGKSLKVGEIRKAFVDLSYPGGMIPLSFVRTYSSFNDDSFPFGRGWDHTPAKIRFTHALAPFSFSDGTVFNLYPQVTIRLEGIESIYTLSGLNHEKQPIYKKEGSPFYLHQDFQGNFIWHRQNELLVFDPQGYLTHLLDRAGKGLQYHYQEGFLTQILHSSGESIVLEYIGNRLSMVIGPGGKAVYYDYDPQGRLKEVRDQEGVLTSYIYDSGDRLIAIHNESDNQVFAAKYDEYHRAIEQQSGKNFATQTFDLRNRSVNFEGLTHSYEHHFDPQYRPKSIQDNLGRNIEFSYGQTNGPQKMISSSGFEEEYEYDTFGRVIKMINPYEGERHFSYNSEGQVIQEMDGEGNRVLYQYDSLGRLSSLYRPFLLTSIDVVNGETMFEGSPKYLTTFEYEKDSTLLKSITFPDGQREIYYYNQYNLPIRVKLSNGILVIREYDDRHRLKKAKAQGNVIEYDYDSRDRVIQVTSSGKSDVFGYDLSGNLISYTDASHHVSQYEYDSHERLIKTIDPLGHSTTYEYEASRLSKMNFSNGSTREIFYDAHGKVAAIR